ncbi:hypothetical protein SELMODRAFT_443658 [Selaginella moellendorffii]|uniref:Uncharacterized protein n=1 Tax=Selaginella moellendorffii TaxID=88036 RepID=D8S3B0_SELML|nr:hypothetical protein SELMODRAFT_443658 [Selaginella moellendorffii]
MAAAAGATGATGATAPVAGAAAPGAAGAAGAEGMGTTAAATVGKAAERAGRHSNRAVQKEIQPDVSASDKTPLLNGKEISSESPRVPPIVPDPGFLASEARAFHFQPLSIDRHEPLIEISRSWSQRWLTPLLYTRLRLEMARARYERAELRIGGAFLVGVSVYVFTLCHWVLRTHFQCKAVLWRVCLYTPRTLAVLYPAMFIVPGIVSFRYSVYAALGVVWMVLCGGGTVVVAAVKGSKVVWLVSTTGFGASYVVLALLGRQYIAPVAPYSEYDQSFLFSSLRGQIKTSPSFWRLSSPRLQVLLQHWTLPDCCHWLSMVAALVKNGRNKRDGRRDGTKGKMFKTKKAIDHFGQMIKRGSNTVTYNSLGQMDEAMNQITETGSSPDVHHPHERLLQADEVGRCVRSPQPDERRGLW